MKRFEFLITLFFTGVISWPCPAQPTGTNSVPTNSLVNESWVSISNRWGSVPLAEVKQAAAHGDGMAGIYLGDAYLNGNGVTKDPNEALNWIKGASDQGYAKAQMYLGWMYENASGVTQDYAAAAKFYRLAAEQGNARAQNNLGSLYNSGQGVPQDPTEAVKWFRKSAEQGDELGESNLGWMYGHGTGVEQDYDLAEKWMRLAAEQGSAKLQYYYAKMLTDEFAKDGHQIANFVVASEWYQKAADRGYAQAQYELAELYNYGKLGDDQRSNCISWYLKAAAQGNTDAQAEIGELPKYYPNSELLKNVDITQFLRQSAENGNLDAQYQLAEKYKTGDGVPKDATEAFNWMKKVTQHDSQASRVGDATYELAVMYENGEGVAQDVSEAHNLFFQAATENQSKAMFRVGQMYETGDGMPQDDSEAAAFYSCEYCDFSSPEKYPKGYLFYGDPEAGAIESVLNLWAQGRGFPTDQNKALPGYHDPDVLIKYWKGYIKTGKAQFYAGEIYYQGKLVPKDIAQAADWFNKAALQGSPEAMNRIGEMWAVGMNDAPDPKEAAKWYQRAADKGLAEAQYNLGLCYAKGEGVAPNPVEAWKWLQLAAGQKLPNASQERDKIQATMTKDQVKDARTLVDQINAVGKQ